MRMRHKTSSSRSIPAVLVGLFILWLPGSASAQCGMYPILGSITMCTPSTPGAGMTCSAFRFVDCFVGTFMGMTPSGGTSTLTATGPGGGLLTMGVPCATSATGMPLTGLGLMLFSNNMTAAGANCVDTMPGTSMVGTRMAVAMGSGPSATCQILWSLKCAVTGMFGTVTTTSCPGCMCTGMDGRPGNQTVARACNFNASGGLPIELMEFSVETGRAEDGP